MATLKNTVVNGSGVISLPSGTVEQRSGQEQGDLRFNTDTSAVEFYQGAHWSPTAEDTQSLIGEYDSGVFKTDYRSRLLPVELWNVGTGGESFFGQNGSTAENRRIWNTDPHGNSAVIWDTPSNDSASAADGGWNSSNVSIDYFRFYRHSMWLKRSVVGNGSTYMGLNSDDGVDIRTSGGRTTNPYFYAGNWPGGTNQWYLFVGHTWPFRSGTGSDHPQTGVYDTNGNKISSCRDYVYREGATRTLHRSYLYYSTITSTSQQYWEPRIDVCDGTEPSIQDLLTNNHNKWRDSIGGNDATPVNWPVYNDTEQAVQFDGNNEYCRTNFKISHFYDNFSFSIIYKFSGSTSATYQALLGNQSENFFVGKNDGNTNIGIQDGNYNSAVATSTDAWDGNWHQITYTRSGSTGTLYLDGVQVGSGSFTGADASDVYIGGKGISYFLTGYVKQVRVYNSAITAANVRKSYEIAKKKYNI